MDFISSSGHARAITTTGVVLTTPQSWDDRYYTRAEVDALISQVVSNQALQNGIFNGLHTLRAQQVADLDARITALEAKQLTFLGAQGGTPVEVHQIQVAPDLKWAYYSGSKILWIQQDDPLPSDPYS